jgi:hypothetical protein
MAIPTAGVRSLCGPHALQGPTLGGIDEARGAGVVAEPLGLAGEVEVRARGPELTASVCLDCKPARKQLRLTAEVDNEALIHEYTTQQRGYFKLARVRADLEAGVGGALADRSPDRAAARLSKSDPGAVTFDRH